MHLLTHNRRKAFHDGHYIYDINVSKILLEQWVILFLKFFPFL